MVSEIYQNISPSELKLPKLHLWMYHIVDSIKSFSAIHKEYVKIPYRLSNKKDIEVQLMKIVCI